MCFVFVEYPSIHELLDALVNDDDIHYVLVDTFNGFHSSVAFEKSGKTSSISFVCRPNNFHHKVVSFEPRVMI